MKQFKIFPKYTNDTYWESGHKDFAKMYGGCEIQLLKESEQIYKTTQEVLALADNELTEISIHLPIKNINVETIPDDILDEHVTQALSASKCYGISINIVVHTRVENQIAKDILVPKLEKFVRKIDGTKVRLLIENSMMVGPIKFSGLTVVDHFKSENLKICLDTTHYRVEAAIHRMEPLAYLKQYLQYDIFGDSLAKYVHQIHFGSLTSDGYVDKKTHGLKHTSKAELIYEVELLREVGLGDLIYVTEINEADYVNRPDMIEEFLMLKDYLLR